MDLDNITGGVDQMHQLLNQDNSLAPVTAQMASQAARLTCQRRHRGAMPDCGR